MMKTLSRLPLVPAFAPARRMTCHVAMLSSKSARMQDSSGRAWSSRTQSPDNLTTTARHDCATAQCDPARAPALELEAEIIEVLTERVAPTVQADGGDVHFEKFCHESGVLTISLSGACIDCPSSTITMRFMIKNCVMHYIPEVANVVRLGCEEDDA